MNTPNQQLAETLQQAASALTKFTDYYPHGVNPWLDEAYGEARDALEALKRLEASGNPENCQHTWETKRQGGDPTEAGSYERITLCKHCGIEKPELD